MYMPTLARFTARDPLPQVGAVLIGGIPQYAYANNNPTNFVDASGLTAIPATNPGQCNAPIKLNEMDDVAFAVCRCLPPKAWTKCHALRIRESGVTVIKQPPPSDVRISTNPNAYFCGHPNKNQYFGPDGMQPSVGFIIQIPDGDGSFTVLHAHMSGKHAPGILNLYDFPKGSHGVMCGGDNSPESNCLIGEVISLFHFKGIRYDGMINWDGCFVGNDGKYYIRTANKPSINDPKCLGN